MERSKVRRGRRIAESNLRARAQGVRPTKARPAIGEATPVRQLAAFWVMFGCGEWKELQCSL